MGGTQPCITKIQLAPFPGGPRRTAKHFPPQWYFISFRGTFLITGATTLCTFCVNTASRGVLKGLNSHTFLKASIRKSNLDAVSEGRGSPGAEGRISAGINTPKPISSVFPSPLLIQGTRTPYHNPSNSLYFP